MLRGNLFCLEDSLFLYETTIKTDRQSLILQKLQEQIPSLVFLNIDGVDLILCPRGLCAYLKRSGPHGLSQKGFTRLQHKAANLGSLNLDEIYDLLSELIGLGHKVERIFGTHLPLGGKHVHFIRAKARFEHCLGLADAVHMALFNLNLRVNFPWKTKISYRNSGLESTRRRIYFSNLDSRPTCVVTRGKTRNRKFALLLHYLRVFPRGLLEKDYVKLIKLSLNGLFSEKMDQDLPEGYPETSIPIFPQMAQNSLDRLTATNEKLKVRLYFNLIQCKSLCAPVGEDMISESYEKHFESLCRPKESCVEVPKEFLEDLYQYGVRVGERVAELYDPFTTTLPNTRSTLEATRHKGGAASALSEERTICQGSRFLDILRSYRSKENQPQRLEPFVIGLFGRPGSGKTTNVRHLTAQLGRKYFPEVPRDKLVYSRSCSMKHWDGYENQPIVVLDDFGQDLADRNDIVEFEQLVSSNRYLVPMAELRDKGRCFNSPIVIMTTNCGYGTNFNLIAKTFVIEEPIAVWRRVAVPIQVNRKNSFSLINKDMLFNEQHMHVWDRKYSTTETNYTAGAKFQASCSVDKVQFVEDFENVSFEKLFQYVSDVFRSHIEYDERHLAPEWCQRISSQRVRYDRDPLSPIVGVTAEPVTVPRLKEDFSLYQTFSSLPPGEPPRVKAMALPEPLKVRMITVAESEVKCLQPLQRALFAYLREQPQFCLTNGCSKSVLWKDFMQDGLPWIERIQAQIQGISSRKTEGDLWLSGDYTAATDNFPMSVTHALIEGILTGIPHPATRAWVRYECGAHIIEYPGGRIGEQTSGQLMGSLLSFPLLCFLNDYIISKSGFPLGSYLINGDDVVACGPRETIEKWRQNAPQVGLSLSLGKNFIHPKFCTVNSQLFYEGECLHTGKVSCQTRLGATIGFCFQETQFYFGNRKEIRDEFIRRNILSLRKTVRSLKVPTSHGGLALAFSPDELTSNEESMARRCWLYDVLHPFLSSVPVPGFTEEDRERNGGLVLRAVPFPCFEKDHESIRTLNALRTVFGGSPTDVLVEDLSTKTVEGLFKKVREKDDSEVFNHLLSIPFSRFPEKSKLGFHVKYLMIESTRVSWMLKNTVPLVLDLIKDRLDCRLPSDLAQAEDVIIEEVNFPTVVGEITRWIFNNFVEEEEDSADAESSTSEESLQETIDEEGNERLEYDIQPRRRLPDDIWLKSILQIGEFAGPFPPVDHRKD
nr:MAG: putative RNA-dependent RNA polymerase [Narnaviridae sp.]